MAVPVRRHLLVGQRLSLFQDIVFCLKPRCPACRQGRLFRPYTISPNTVCATCGFHLGQHDIGDGAAVFLIFILGGLIIPLAWAFELAYAPPLWVHAVLWSFVSLGLILLLLPATKAMIILLEYRHRPGEKNGGGNDDRRA